MVSRGQKGRKLPIPQKMRIRSWKIAQRYHFWPQTLYCHSFNPFKGTLGVKMCSLGVKWRSKWQNLLIQKNNLSPEIWYCHSFSINHKFWSLLGHTGHQMGVRKGQKLSIALIITHKSCKFTRVDGFSWETWCYHIFNRILPFFEPFLGHSRDQEGLKIAKISPSFCK